jgi:hypothetical protein
MYLRHMNMTNNITISGIDGSIAYCEAKGFSRVFMAYANQCSREDIMEIGFNPNSGYVYIALENGISICSCMGHQVDFLVTNFYNGEETFYDTYEEALKHESMEED